MWLKNLTPVGLVSYLVVNYGYDQVLRLLDGNIEVAKQHLTTYFSKHDAEITPEQASYLANVAMKVLQAGGQIAVHQVAANRFNAVRKGGEVKQRGATKKSIGEKGGVKGSEVEVSVAKVAKKTEKAERVMEGAKARGTIIQQTFKNLGSLKGVGTLETNKILKSSGFVFKGRTPGGYYKYYHPNGAKIQIRPDGQVYRYGGGRGLKYNSDGYLSKVHGQESILK
jgi:hypothetical protein